MGMLCSAAPRPALSDRFQVPIDLSDLGAGNCRPDDGSILATETWRRCGYVSVPAGHERAWGRGPVPAGHRAG